MQCPRCSAPICQDALHCGVCAFDLPTLDDKLGKVLASIDPVMDVAHCLRLADKAPLEALIDDLERRFPQMHLSVFLGVLPAGMNVSEAGFWILNRGVRKRRDKVCDNRFGLLIMVEPAARQAGIATGYALESILEEGALVALLEKHSHHLWHSDYGTALRHIILGIDSLLRAAGKARRRCPEKSSSPTLGERLGLRRGTRPLQAEERSAGISSQRS